MERDIVKEIVQCAGLAFSTRRRVKDYIDK
jgi:hypothetical protein